MRSDRIRIIQGLVFIAIAIAIITVNAGRTDETGRESILNSTQAASAEVAPSTQIEPSIEHLIGTCPRSRQCARPACSLWSDLDKDGICDRSVR